jgi:hypothetical protein
MGLSIDRRPTTHSVILASQSMADLTYIRHTTCELESTSEQPNRITLLDVAD